MEKNMYIILSLVFLVSCTTGSQQEPLPPMIPDHTPYIAGMIEFSPDTTHHYPEIVVGYFTEADINLDEPYNRDDYLTAYPEIYTPSLLRQVIKTSQIFELNWDAETNAEVSVRGPLGTPKEKTITFTHEGNGVYGDRTYALPRTANGKYELRVTLPDGRTFGSRTYIPEAVDFTVPDSIGVPVRFEPQGPPSEIQIEKVPMAVPSPENGFLKISQWNTSVDRELLLMKPNEHFLYTDRSNYLRTGIGFYVGFVEQPSDTFSFSWAQRLDKPRNELWKKQHHWFRFSFHSPGIGKFYRPLMYIYSSSDEWSKKMGDPANKATITRDTTYLFDVSTIDKIGENGEVMPKVKEAIGFFSGYYSLYKQTTVYPVRNFDLDSVLTANGQ